MQRRWNISLRRFFVYIFHAMPTNNDNGISYDNHQFDNDDNNNDKQHNHHHNFRSLVLHVVQRTDLLGRLGCSLHSVASRYADAWQRLRVLQLRGVRGAVCD